MRQSTGRLAPDHPRAETSVEPLRETDLDVSTRLFLVAEHQEADLPLRAANRRQNTRIALLGQ